jgi:hypothetical protein
VCILRQHAVPFQDARPEGGMFTFPPVIPPKGKSKLRKWQCPCGQNARVGKKEFHATCDLCSRKFILSS